MKIEYKLRDPEMKSVLEYLSTVWDFKHVEYLNIPEMIVRYVKALDRGRLAQAHHGGGYF